ncbi:MAG: DUF58 domain-containing protein [Pyrobaculum sp.]
MKNLVVLAAALLVIGAVIESREVAILSLMPLTAYVVGSALPPPKVSASRRRVGSYVELSLQTDAAPGVLYVYDSPPPDSPTPPPRRTLFKPPFKKQVKIRYKLEGASAPASLTVISYNLAMNKSSATVFVEPPPDLKEPRLEGPGVEEFQEVRPYQPGDPLRFLNWKIFAKTGDLYVNRYTGAEVKRAVVVIDGRRLKGLVTSAAAKAAQILAEKGYEVTYYVLGHGPAEKIPASFTPSCRGHPPCGDLTLYVGSLHDVCPVRCPRVVYLDAAASNPLVAVRRLSLYKKLRAQGAAVLTQIEDLWKAA